MAISHKKILVLAIFALAWFSVLYYFFYAKKTVKKEKVEDDNE